MVSKEALYKIKFFLLVVFLIFIDFYSKNLAIENLVYGQSLETLIPFIDLLLIYNSGIAFGIFDNGSVFTSYILLILTLLISLYLIWMIINESEVNKKIALSIITAGAFGNILDRINDGQVTDFLHLEILNFSFFIFNFADAFITIGAILIIYFEFIYKPKNE